MSTAICLGHNYQSKTANAAMPNYCEVCRVWWGLGVATGAVVWFDGSIANIGRRAPHIAPSMLPSEDDAGSATEIARLREEVARLQRERDEAREDFVLIDTQRVRLMDEAANMRASFESLYAERDTARTSLAAALTALDDAATLLASEGYEEQANALRAQGGIRIIGTAGPSPLAAALAERDALAVRVGELEAGLRTSMLRWSLFETGQAEHAAYDACKALLTGTPAAPRTVTRAELRSLSEQLVPYVTNIYAEGLVRSLLGHLGITIEPSGTPTREEG